MSIQALSRSVLPSVQTFPVFLPLRSGEAEKIAALFAAYIKKDAPKRLRDQVKEIAGQNLPMKITRDTGTGEAKIDLGTGPFEARYFYFDGKGFIPSNQSWTKNIPARTIAAYGYEDNVTTLSSLKNISKQQLVAEHDNYDQDKSEGLPPLDVYIQQRQGAIAKDIEELETLIEKQRASLVFETAALPKL